jgi:hypothetical protein
MCSSRVIALFSALALYGPLLYSTSVVYNLRIATTTRRQASESTPLRPSVGAVTLFDQWRHQYDGIRQDVIGGLGTLVYVPRPFYMRVDWAAAYLKQKHGPVQFSRVETDDLLFTAGYSHALGHKSRFTVSGLFGLPTHKDRSLDFFQFGPAHVGLGLQIDGSCTYSSENNLHQRYSIMGAARIIHFFPRTTTGHFNGVAGRFNFTIGNVADLLIAHNCTWGHHNLEVGYNPTFLFSTRIHPFVKIVIDQARSITSNFYAAYQYNFSVNNLPSAFVLGCSYGFDHIRLPINDKRVITLWASWGINF